MRLHATQLDAYRYWRDSQETVPLWRLEHQLMGVAGVTDDMRRGRALAAVLEDPARYRCHSDRGALFLSCDGRDFAAAEIMRLRDTIGAQAWEVSTTLHIGGHEIRCRADALTGSLVHEVKCPSRSWDPHSYQNAYQWRLYLLAFAASALRYHVVRLQLIRGVSRVTAHEQFELYPYHGLGDDVAELVEDFVGFVHERSLEPYIGLGGGGTRIEQAQTTQQ